MPLRIGLCFAFFGILSVSCLSALSPRVFGADDKKDSVDRDYSAELPRIKPVEPKQALATFKVAKGFRIEQVAAEPLVTDPIAMAFDDQCRLFVVEMRGYSEDGEKNLGQIRVLEDTNEDGRFDKSTVFIDGLSWPTAITCWDGGVFVGAPPHIYYFKDTDGDQKADVNKIVFTGFGRGNVQGLLNTFKWGMDNRIHGATSSSGANVVSGDGKQSKQKPLALRGRDFSIDPRTLDMQPTSGGGQHGMSFDPWGNKFVCSNSNHAQFVLFEDRYVARNPFLAAPSSRAMIASDGPQADVFRSSPIEPWRIVRTRLRKQGIVPGPVEGGGTPAGYFTGATGITIFRGDAWPKEYHGWAVIGDVGSNLIHRKRLESDGVGFKAHRVDKKSEFVTSSDIWFRPVQFANAPDGALYIADMYREVIEHPASLHPVVKKHLDLTSGRDRGRIYRVVAKDFKQPKLPKLGSAATTELVAHLDSKNGWQRETAARLLFERQDLDAVAPLEKLAGSAKIPEGRIWAMYALDGLQALSADVMTKQLADRHPSVRQHAVRLAEKLAAQSPAVRAKLYALVDDPDLRVRYQLAFSLGELSGPRRLAALTQLLKEHAGDNLFRLAVRSSLAEGSGVVLGNLARDKSFGKANAEKQTLRELAAQIGRQQRSEDVAAAIELISRLTESDKGLSQLLVESLAAKPDSDLQKQLAAATGGRAEALMKELVASASQVAVDANASVEQRTKAIHQLRLGRLEDQQKTLEQLLNPTEPLQVQAAVLGTLSAFDSPRVASLLMDRWSTLSPSIRREAASVLFSRAEWTRALLDQVSQDKIKVGDLEPGRLQLLASHKNAAIRELAAGILKDNAKLWQRSEVLTSYQGSLKLAGDTARGKAIFKKNCSACHQAEGVGHAIGPNLAAMRNRGPEAILMNVLNPNREVNPQYLNYIVQTTEGRSLTGMIAAETANSVTLRRAENKTETILRVDIDELRSTGQSLMPVGMEKEINKQAMADLITYLLSLK